MELFKEKEQNEEEIIGNFTPHNLETKLVKAFDKEVKFLIIQNKKLLAPKHLTTIDDQSFENLKDADILNKAALSLRKSILQAEKKKLPNDICVRDLQEGEVTVTKDLSEFYNTLIAGSNGKRKKNPKCMRQVQSLCEDVVYCVYNEKYKTSKHIKLGMTLKSLTSSRKIVDIIHRYGHSIIYSGVEELETETTYFSLNKSMLCPKAIKKKPNLSTVVAFDNFDRFVETSSGKDTMHDTVGIIYQNIDPNTQDESDVQSLPSVSNQKTFNLRKRKRRTFEGLNLKEEPYPKQPKMIYSLDISVHEDAIMPPTNLQLYSNIDTTWMLSHALQLPNLPMWVGYNCLISYHHNTKQILSYLTPINASPTNKSVILETMKQSQRICEEVKQSSIQVTYDLAIARVALQIQATEAPKFDNIFIHLGPFHIMMSYFKTIGKFLVDCGLTNIMVQSNLLASGSVGGFLEGKHFNRCKRLHPLMSVGLETLHFRSFLDINIIQVTDTMIEEINRLQNTLISSFNVEN
ncbi:unnamed protein product [Psylliodes chrysocephalus]|uniref:Uncharacterized protein n=1 Tax=Psylliodes chrysocephalus TaxID=3402493 RepID=A0A9P0D228_9CUCU|nr:unnamed protein product [Psylliodes chrysocephala]